MMNMSKVPLGTLHPPLSHLSLGNLLRGLEHLPRVVLDAMGREVDRDSSDVKWMPMKMELQRKLFSRW